MIKTDYSFGGEVKIWINGVAGNHASSVVVKDLDNTASYALPYESAGEWYREGAMSMTYFPGHNYSVEADIGGQIYSASAMASGNTSIGYAPGNGSTIACQYYGNNDSVRLDWWNGAWSMTLQESEAVNGTFDEPYMIADTYFTFLDQYRVSYGSNNLKTNVSGAFSAASNDSSLNVGEFTQKSFYAVTPSVTTTHTEIETSTPTITLTSTITMTPTREVKIEANVIRNDFFGAPSGYLNAKVYINTVAGNFASSAEARNVTQGITYTMAYNAGSNSYEMNSFYVEYVVGDNYAVDLVIDGQTYSAQAQAPGEAVRHEYSPAAGFSISCSVYGLNDYIYLYDTSISSLRLQLDEAPLAQFNEPYTVTGASVPPNDSMLLQYISRNTVSPDTGNFAGTAPSSYLRVYHEYRETFLAYTSTPTPSFTCTSTRTYTHTSTVTPTQTVVVITLNPSNDTGIVKNSPGNNYGTCTNNNTGTSAAGDTFRTLLKFDTSSIPAGSTIIDAVLSVDIPLINSSAGSGNINFHRLTTDFTEGAQCSNAGTPNWTSPWTMAGGDYNSTVYGTVNFTDGETSGKSVALISLAQYWVTNPGLNYGLIMKLAIEGAADSYMPINSSEATGFGNNKPSLTITYRP